MTVRDTPVMAVALAEEADVVLARQRARQIAALLGFDTQDQTRIATAVSEIARNAATYGGGGRVEFAVQHAPRALSVTIRDRGPGIASLPAILDGRYRSSTGLGVGIAGARRLMDRFDIAAEPGAGTTVILAKLLPRTAPALDQAFFAEAGRKLAAAGSVDPASEVRMQNQDLLRSLAALKAKGEETERLNAELENTNRGVVALYAELDQKAAELSSLNAGLESRVTAAVAEVQRANDALRQSQKMEAVGQLTGGIAHDFNNLLQIIVGNLELLGRRLPAGDARSRRAADSAMTGAQRAATLTQRLLAFSRRQPLAPRPIEVNRLVDGMSDLIDRTLGETVTVETRLARDLWVIECDANQLENALLNLAVNARDAMSPGGTLTIVSANCMVGPGEPDAAAGPYVSIAVRDTGMGMTADTMAHVFEPFFTTKETGKGTGLGLSMVYGFVKQSGGHLRIESDVGRGTTVSLYLPRYLGAVPQEQAKPAEAAEAAQPGETILVVEDNADVRAHSCDVLRELGYSVLGVPDGPSAIAVLDGTARVDLVFTDVILAGHMTGRDVADHARLVRPATPVLFTSGYVGGAIAHNDRLDADVRLLAKPFSYAALAAKVRECLHTGHPPSPAPPGPQADGAHRQTLP